MISKLQSIYRSIARAPYNVREVGVGRTPQNAWDALGKFVMIFMVFDEGPDMALHV